jgi:hypothetical protein
MSASPQVVPVLAVLDDLRELVEDLWLADVTTDEEDARFELLIEQIEERYRGI